MSQEIIIVNNFTPTKQPIIGKLVHIFEGRQIPTVTATGIGDTPTTTITASLTGNASVIALTAITPTPTAAPSQNDDHKIPILVGVCIPAAFILIGAFILIIRHSRKRRPIQTGEAQSTILSTRQPSPITGGLLYEQRPSFSETLNRQINQQPSFNSRPHGRQKPAREVNSPVGSFQPVMGQSSQRELRTVSSGRSAEVEQQMAALNAHMRQLSGQVEHLQRHLAAHTDNAQALSDTEAPPAYAQS